MKKMNNYEAPMAEVIELQAVGVLMESGDTNTNQTGNTTGGGAGGFEP